MMKITLAAITAVVAQAAVAEPAQVTAEVLDAFAGFQKKFGKQYASDNEWSKRAGVFAQNLEMVNRQNAEHILVGGEAVFGITKFMDLTPEEFKATYLSGYIARNESNVERVDVKADGPLGTTVDWRTKGALTAVKDQGQCGSCWAFSATEAIESYNFLAGKPLVSLSPQQINSCDKVDQGCNGGNTETAYQYVQQAGGIELNSDYPYTSGGGNTGSCQFDASKVAVKVAGYTSVSTGEPNLKTALNNGPVSVCLAANAFQTYTSGILKICPGQIDHCVQAIGYDDTDNYWIVRNSWSSDWGEDGFIRLEMGKDICHIADDVTFPTF
jgi:hypothetical protein